VDNLPIGLYNYTITVEDVSDNTSSDTVLVTVRAETFCTKPIALIVTIGSGGVIAVVIVFIVRSKS
jgi:hypothetical protein